MKLAFDLDCVCVNTTERMVEYINERLPVNLSIENITTYSIEAALPPQYKWIVDAGFRDKEMWKGVKLLPHCAEVMKKLYNEGFEIYFATSSLPENLRKKINHLSRNMPFFPKGYIERHTINICDKYLLNVDVLIDDCLEHIANEKRGYWSVVLDYPWNRNIDLPRISRAYNWFDIYEKIHMIKENNYDDV